MSPEPSNLPEDHSFRLMLRRPLAALVYTIAVIAVVLSVLHAAEFCSSIDTKSAVKNAAASLRKMDTDASLRQTTATSITKPTMLVGIFSTHNEQLRRQYIRETMLNVSDDFLCPLDVYLASNVSECRVIYAFIVGAGAADAPQKNTQATNLTQAVLSSSDDEPDVVRLSIQENMDHGKSPTYFAYGALLDQELRQQSFRHIDYIAKMDSDTLMNIQALDKFMNDSLVAYDAPRYLPTYGGMMLDWMKCGGESHCDVLQGRVYMQGESFSSCTVFHCPTSCLPTLVMFYSNRRILFHESALGTSHYFSSSRPAAICPL